MSSSTDTLERVQGELVPGQKFCGLISSDKMPDYRKSPLRTDIVERLSQIQGNSKHVYINVLHMPLRIDHYTEGPGNKVWAFVVEGNPDAEGVYACAALCVIEHVDGNTYYERHCGKERKTGDGDIEVVEEWAITPEDIHTADEADEDFIVRATREAKPLPLAA